MMSQTLRSLSLGEGRGKPFSADTKYFPRMRSSHSQHPRDIERKVLCLAISKGRILLYLDISLFVNKGAGKRQETNQVYLVVDVAAEFG